MIINQTNASGSGGLDTSDATAYPEHIMLGYTAYARGAKITGTRKPKISLLSGVSNNIASGTSLSLTFTGAAGKICILSVAIRTTVTTISDGWQLLTSSPQLTFDTTNYHQNHIYYKVATGASETVTITQSVSGRLYMAVMCLDTDIVPTADTTLNGISTATTGGYIDYTKQYDKCYVVSIGTPYWSTISPYPTWYSTPVGLKYVHQSFSVQNRLGTFIDDDPPALRQIYAPTYNMGSSNNYKLVICSVYFA